MSVQIRKPGNISPEQGNMMLLFAMITMKEMHILPKLLLEWN